MTADRRARLATPEPPSARGRDPPRWRAKGAAIRRRRRPRPPPERRGRRHRRRRSPVIEPPHAAIRHRSCPSVVTVMAVSLGRAGRGAAGASQATAVRAAGGCAQDAPLPRCSRSACSSAGSPSGVTTFGRSQPTDPTVRRRSRRPARVQPPAVGAWSSSTALAANNADAVRLPSLSRPVSAARRRDCRAGACRESTSVETLGDHARRDAVRDGDRHHSDRRRRRPGTRHQPRRPRDERRDRELPMNAPARLRVAPGVHLEQEPARRLIVLLAVLTVLVVAQRHGRGRARRSFGFLGVGAVPRHPARVRARLHDHPVRGSLFWFLSRPRKYTVTPDDPQIGMSFENYRGQPDLLEHAKSTVGSCRASRSSSSAAARCPRACCCRARPGTGKTFLAGVHRGRGQPAVHLHRRELAARHVHRA